MKAITGIEFSQNNGITGTLRNFIDPHQNCYFQYSLNIRYTKNIQQHNRGEKSKVIKIVN